MYCHKYDSRNPPPVEVFGAPATVPDPPEVPGVGSTPESAVDPRGVLEPLTILLSACGRYLQISLCHLRLLGRRKALRQNVHLL